MQRVQIPIPASLDLPSALELSLALNNIAPADEYIFNFSKTQHVEPFPMLLVSSEIRRLLTRQSDSKVGCSNYSHMTYAGHMGFFKAFGLEFGKAPGRATGSSQYLPMTILPCAELIQDATNRGVEVGDAVEGKSKHMAAMLCGDDEGSIFETLSYSIREMMRNVVEHSEASQLGICAQYWPSKNRVEVAILDRGIGLRSSLQNNPHLDARNVSMTLQHLGS